METEKKRSKGGFLNLFDWNGKSRKKLFANVSEELSGTHGSKEEKEEAENSMKPNNYTVDLDENEASSSNKGSGDWNSGSCVTSEDGGGIVRAPGVVARLMGLDSLPASNVAEPSLNSAQLSESSHHDRTNLRSEVYPAEYASMSNRIETFSRNRVESRSQRHINTPIERFQTEVLPPRSAKSISITHHKLLSPIKNPGFVPTKNVTYIMEAAAKIIEASPRSSAKNKVSTTSIGTSSVPMRIRDLKEKIEAANKASRAERPKEAGALKYNRGQYSNKYRNGSEYVLVTREPVDSENRNYQNTRVKGRSVSPSLQAKNSFQGNGSASCGGNKSIVNRKGVKSNSLSKSQPSIQRSEQKRNSPESSNNVLRQNNQKQNCVSNKDKLAGKNAVSNSIPRRTRSTNGSIDSNKTSNTNNTNNKATTNSKTGSRKAGSVSSSSIKTVSQKKKLVSSNIRSEETASSSNNSRLISEVERSLNCTVSMDSCSNMSPDSRKPGMDVISFTFNSPLKKSPRESRSSGQVVALEKKRFGINSIISGDEDQHQYSNGFTLSSPGLNVIGADSLSALLEQKLLELTSKVQLYESNRVREESSASCATVSEDSNIVSAASRGKQVQSCLLTDKADSVNSFDSPSVDGQLLSMNQNWQDGEECSGSSNNTGKELEYGDVSPESSFEISFENGTFTDTRSCASGSKGCYSYNEAQSRCENESFLSENIAIESPESTPSRSSACNTDAKQLNQKFDPEDLHRETNWELEYVRDILSNADLAAEEFTLGRAKEVVARDLFERLESGEEEQQQHSAKLGRKVVFDYVNESLVFRCERVWSGPGLAPRKDWLAEELFEEISGLKNMADWMLDDLVEKEMSTRIGRWLDFDEEAFEEGVEIGEVVLDSLVDELVSELSMVF